MMLPIYPVRSEQSPRKIIAQDFKSMAKELPISGGWGYAMDDAVIIDKNDPTVDVGFPFDGMSIEYVFVQKRIYEELIVFRPKGEQYSGIRWNRTRQELIEKDGRIYDKLEFEITAFRDQDWQALKAEWEGPNGHGSPDFDEKAHISKREACMVKLNREFWFDITSYY